MKSVVKACVLSLGVLTAAPALAQPLPPLGAPAPSAWDLNRRLDWLQDRINRGRSDGSLDRREGRRVERELQRIRYDESRMRARHGGRLSDSDRRMLEARVDRLSDNIRWLRHNDERRPWQRK